MFMPFSSGTKDSDYSISDSPEPDLKTASISLHRYTDMTSSSGTKDSDYSISDSPEPDLKTASISLHRYTDMTSSSGPKTQITQFLIHPNLTLKLYPSYIFVQKCLSC
jgi:hypothetical protein